MSVTTWANIPAHLAAQSGDTQRGTIGVDTSALNEPLSRVHNGAVRFTAGQQEVTQDGVARHTVNFDGVAGGGVMATRQRVNGADTVETTPGQPGSRTHISQALREGLIRETAPGVYEDVRSANGSQRTLQDVQAEKEAAQQQQAAEQVDYIDAEEEADWAEDIAPLPQHAYDAATASAIGVILRGTGCEDTIKGLAHNAGMPLELAADYIQQGYAKGQRMADRALAPLGLTGARLTEFYEAAKARPQELQDAIQRLWLQNDAGGFKTMAIAWKVANPGDLSAYQQAGFQTSVDRDTGEVMVQRGSGPWVKASELGK